VKRDDRPPLSAGAIGEAPGPVHRAAEETAHTPGLQASGAEPRHGIAAGDDYAAMKEVLTRRYRKVVSGEGKVPDLVLIDGGKGQLGIARQVFADIGLADVAIVAVSKGEERKPGLEQLWPDLVLIDGGKGQMSSVRDALEELGIEDVPLIAIAKGPHHGREGREVFHFPDGREKTLPVNSPVLFYLQRLRDEVHRFAIGAHREKRSRAITASPLDEIPGIGPARKRALLLHFGTAGKVRAAALEDLQRAPGVSGTVAQAVYDFYHPRG